MKRGGSLGFVLAVLAVVSLVHCHPSGFLQSPYHLDESAEQSIILSGLFNAPTCAIYSTCSDDAKHYGNSVVELADPLTGYYCSGTLIKGPNGRNFILAARHCYALETTKAVRPLSTHVALFNYRLPCNATRAGNITKEFSDFLQGLSLIFVDVHADMVVLELLQDIPPHWQVTYAGLDARVIDEDFVFVDFSHPSGDGETVTVGRASHELMQGTFTFDGKAITGDRPCVGDGCASYQVHMDEGALAPGSSGSGLIHADLRRVVGVASMADDPYCAGSDAVFGATSRAWVEGMFKLWPNATADKPIQVDYEPYKSPTPTITIGNIVPELSPAVGPASISIQLQQKPKGPVNVTLHVDSTAFRVSLSRYTVSFNSSNWSKAQLVHIRAEEDVPEENGAAEFRLDLSWPAAWANGTLVQRTKTIRGIVRPPIEGTSMLNPIPVPGNDSFYMETEFRMYNPELPLVSENDGPFTPGITYSYSRTSSDVLLISMCPKSGSIVNSTKLSVEPYGADFRNPATVLFTSLEVKDDFYTGCSLSLVASPRNEDVFLHVHSTYNWSVPGFSIDLEGEVAIAMDTLTPAEGLDLLKMKGDLTMQSPENYTAFYNVFSGPLLTAFLPQKSGLYQFSVCYNLTNVATTLDVWSGETLEPVASMSSTGDDCVEMDPVIMVAGTPYFSFLRSRRQGSPVRHAEESAGFTIDLVWEANE